ncbi:MAG: glycosyltransferase family 2 protein [Desulfobulbaceae bacterium]|nr:glycosyltransferase family 2 protein [Desulfobulbaceae bacterium]HIJ89332.1 glycosyltransferase family 2 protein [Deltaproteobacteria bacterium]
MTTQETAEPQVAVLLCTKDGERFLAEQLDSINCQTFSSWKVWASDDGSCDGTRAILDHYRAMSGGRFSVQPGPQRGYAANFLSLVCNEKITAEYYAFSDQDDIWEVDKLARAVAWLKAVPATEPALYCSRTRLIDETGREIGLSPLFSRPPGFANALVQNIGGGNTMVFNHAARLLLQEAGCELDVFAHDWWLYLLVSGCGGTVFYDPRPMVRYRQQGMNLMGANIGWLPKLVRIRLLLQGRFREWNAGNLKALQGVSRMLTSENRQILKGWAEFRQQPLLPRLLGFKRIGVYRQTPAGNLGLLVAALFRRM